MGCADEQTPLGGVVLGSSSVACSGEEVVVVAATRTGRNPVSGTKESLMGKCYNSIFDAAHAALL